MLELNETIISVDVLLTNMPNKKTRIRMNNDIIKNFLNMNNESYIIYNFENPIEWTPVKLYQYVYYLLRSRDELWIIRYSKFNGLEYNYMTNILELLVSRINYTINFNTKAPIYLINMYLYNLKNNENGAYNYLCTTDNINNKYDNYILKWNNKIHYVQLIY